MAHFVPFIIDTAARSPIGVTIARMKRAEAAQTEKEPLWQASWLSDYMQDNKFEKYAL